MESKEINPTGIVMRNREVTERVIVTTRVLAIGVACWVPSSSSSSSLWSSWFVKCVDAMCGGRVVIRGSQCFADADADPFLFSNFAKIEKGRSKFR